MGTIFLVIIKCRTVRILSTAIKEEGKAESNLYMWVGRGGGGGGGGGWKGGGGEMG